MPSQQDQTARFFETFAGEWQGKAVGSHDLFSTIKARHDAVLAILDDLTDVRRVLDVGCGAGQLSVSMAARGIAAEGIDFAPSMIELCECNARAAGVANTKFTCASFFDVELADGAYDLISAQGFIEYIPLDELDDFLARCRGALRPGGTLALGSRNRLFNVHSMNAFTQAEIEMGTLASLVEESVALHMSQTLADALGALRRLERIDPHPDNHPDTGIAVKTRYQFTPADLAYRLRSAGLELIDIFPINFQGLPPALARERPDIQSRIALFAAEAWRRDHRAVPFSSSFVMRADKRV